MYNSVACRQPKNISCGEGQGQKCNKTTYKQIWKRQSTNYKQKESI